MCLLLISTTSCLEKQKNFIIGNDKRIKLKQNRKNRKNRKNRLNLQNGQEIKKIRETFNI